MKHTILIPACLALASGVVAAAGISLNFASNEASGSIDTTAGANPAGAIAISGEYWNNLSGANGTGVAVAVDNDGNVLSGVTVDWSSNNTWRSASGGATATSQNGALTKGYLDDGGGWTATLNSPYLLNDIYVIHGTDQGDPATMSAVSVNGVFYKGDGAGGTIPASGSGDSWSASNFSTADALIESDNYIQVLGQAGVSLAGLNGSPGRTTLSGVQVEDAYTGTLSYWDLDGATAGAGSISGDASGNWADANWSSSASGEAATANWTSGNGAVFSAGSDADGTSTITLGGTENADAVWVQEGNLIFTGGTLALGGTGLLRADDPQGFGDGLQVDSILTGSDVSLLGLVSLNNPANAVTGTVTVLGETVLGADNTWGQLAGGGILDLQDNTLTVGDATDSTAPSIVGGVGSGLGKTGTGTLTVGNVLDSLDSVSITDGTLALTGGGNTFWSLNGAGTLVKNGGGTLSIESTGNTGFTGKVAATGGILRIPGQDTLGLTPASLVTDHITLSGGARIQGGAGAGADITLDANRGITLAGGNSGFHSWTGFTTTVDGPISGTGNLTKSDGGGLIINGGSTHVGDTRVEAGVMDVRSAITSSDNLRVTGTSELVIGPGAEITTSRFVSSDGNGAKSTITQNGGILNITGTNNANNTGASFLLGHWGANAASTTYNFSDGEINSTGAELSFGWDSALVTMNQTGGTANLLGLDLANGRGNAATYNLDAGTLNIGANGITNAGAKTVNIGAGTLGSLASWSSAKPLVLTGTGGDATISPNGTDSITLNAILSGAGGLVKAGTGTLALSGGLGTYAGSTQVNAGTLQVVGDATGFSPVALATGTTIRTGTATTAGLATVESLDLADGTSSTFRVGGGSTDELVVFQTDGLNLASGGTHTIAFQPVGALGLGEQVVLIDYDGAIQGAGFAGFTAGAFPNPHYDLALVDNAANTSIDMIVNDITEINWTGAGGTVWDLVAANNWDDGTASSLFYESDIVNFGDLDPAESVVVDTNGGADPIAPASMAFANTTATTYTISGDAISGPGGLTKTGDGTVILANDNTFTGAVDVQAGTLQLGDGGTTGSINGASLTTVAPGAQLAFNHSDDRTEALSITGGGSVVKEGTNVLTLNSTGNEVALVVNGGTLRARGGSWAGTFNSGSITVGAGGTLDTATHSMGGLGGATLPASVTLDGGTWFFNNEQYISVLNMTAGLTSGPGELRTTGGGVFSVNAAATSSEMANRLNMVGGKTIFVDDGAADPDLLISGPIVGAGNLTKTGPGTLVTSGANTAAGAIFVNEGEVIFTGDNSGRTGGTALNGTTLNTASVSDAAIGSGYLALNDGTLNYTGTGSETTTRLLWIDQGSGTLNIADAGASLTMNPAGGAVSMPVIKDGAGRLVLQGPLTGAASVTVNAGRLDLDGANTNTGDTTVETGATLVLSGTTLDDEAALSINGTGVVDLDFVGTDTIGELLIDGIAAAPGTYGATGSGADNIDDVHFAGTGVVEVLPEDDYLLWGPTVVGWTFGDANTGKADDFDGDGRTNEEEYAFGLDPVSPASSEAISVPLDKTSGKFTYTRRATGLSNWTYVIETSTDLETDWAVDAGATESVLSTVDGVETVEVTLTGPLGDRVFVRVSASAPAP